MTMQDLTVKIFIENTGEKFDERGFNYKKYNILTCSPFDKNGFDYEGIHKITKREFDPNGWNYYGLNEKNTRTITTKRALIVMDMIKMGIIKKDIPEKI